MWSTCSTRLHRLLHLDTCAMWCFSAARCSRSCTHGFNVKASCVAPVESGLAWSWAVPSQLDDAVDSQCSSQGCGVNSCELIGCIQCCHCQLLHRAHQEPVLQGYRSMCTAFVHIALPGQFGLYTCWDSCMACYMPCFVLCTRAVSYTHLTLPTKA